MLDENGYNSWIRNVFLTRYADGHKFECWARHAHMCFFCFRACVDVCVHARVACTERLETNDLHAWVHGYVFVFRACVHACVRHSTSWKSIVDCETSHGHHFIMSGRASLIKNKITSCVFNERAMFFVNKCNNNNTKDIFKTLWAAR